MATISVTKLNGRPIKDADGRALIAQEISDRKSVEADLRQLIAGKQEAKSFPSLASLISTLNGASNTAYVVGTNLYITEKDVPDFWIGQIKDTKVTGNLTDLVAANYNAYQVGYYMLYQLETYIDISGIAVNAADITKLKNWGKTHAYFSQVEGTDYNLQINTYEDGNEGGEGTGNILEAKCQKVLLTSGMGEKLDVTDYMGQYSFLCIETENRDGYSKPNSTFLIGGELLEHEYDTNRLSNLAMYKDKLQHVILEKTIVRDDNNVITGHQYWLYFKSEDIASGTTTTEMFRYKIYGI